MQASRLMNPEYKPVNVPLRYEKQKSKATYPSGTLRYTPKTWVYLGAPFWHDSARYYLLGAKYLILIFDFDQSYQIIHSVGIIDFLSSLL